MNTTEREGMTNISLTPSLDSDELLREAHRRKVKAHIPLLTFLSVIAVVGIIGNILTIIFYGFKIRVKKSSTIVLITLLALFDLIVCFLCFTTIADVSVNILFTSDILCQVMYFFDHWIVVSSVFTLWIIAIDRYRRMCQPQGRQLTVKSAVAAVLSMSTFSMLFSIHDFFTFSTVKVNISTFDSSIPYVTGHYCTNSDDPDLHTAVTVFHILDAVTMTACLVTFIFTYGNIWRSLRQHNRNTVHLHLKSSASFQQSTSEGNSKVCKDDESGVTDPLTRNPNVHFSLGSDINTEHLPVSPSTSSFVSTDTKLTSPNNSVKCRRSEKCRKSSRTSRSERSLTIMMFAVTVGFVICFTPYFIVSVGIRLSSATTESELDTGIQFALRSPFWNSVINPIIFCVFNTHYRRYVKEVFTQCQVSERSINSSTS